MGRGRAARNFVSAPLLALRFRVIEEIALALQ